MAYKKLKIICDADDVLISCNAYALQLLSQTKGQYFDISGITAWGSMGNELDERMQFFEYEEFYENQPALPGARKFLISLMEKANVFIATAVYPEFMGNTSSEFKSCSQNSLWTTLLWVKEKICFMQISCWMMEYIIYWNQTVLCQFYFGSHGTRMLPVSVV